MAKQRLKPAIRNGAIGFVIGLALCSIVSLSGCLALKGSQERKEISSTTLKTSLEQASDLITTKYYYSDIGKFENSYEINGWSIPFTGKNFILSYQGEALLGFSIDDVKIELNGNRIHVTCPPIQILSNTIPAESVEVYDQSFNIFNQVTIDDYLEFETNQKKIAEQKMRDNGVFEQAKEDAKTSIMSVLNVIPDIREDYHITIDFEEQPEESTQTSSQASSSTNSTESNQASN
ncbi:MAG: DUF4230 domain-containing protein [Erysipelotrichaceae bacterium]|nr:DUF4230 domain-containing protein [Erysipelotrichaceae bacterium]